MKPPLLPVIVLALVCRTPHAAVAQHPEPQRLGGWQFTRATSRVNLSSGKRHHLFYAGESVGFTWTASGGAAATNFEVRDYAGDMVAQGALTPGQTSLALPTITQPGWYKLYLFGTPVTATYGDALGTTTFVIFRNDPNFAARPAINAPGGGSFPVDAVMHGLIGAGPQRNYFDDVVNPAADYARNDADVTVERHYYLDNDPQRPRKLMLAFRNGITAAQVPAFQAVVNYYKNDIRYYEPRNEPNGVFSGAAFATGEMKLFYEAVKAVDPNLKVLGPGIVTINPGGSGLGWITDFLHAGGGSYVDGFSFHLYNGVNGDLTLGRRSLSELMRVLAQFNFSKEKWQTEQGYFAAMYGAYLPRHQGQWTMMQKMLLEQSGVPKEQDHLWYDRSHGFWDFPTWIENDDGSLNPGAALMRVWAEELHGTNFVRAFEFGPLSNRLYIGSLFQGPGKSVAAVMGAGKTDGSVTFDVTGGGGTLRLVSAFGVSSSVAVNAGRATVPVAELPVYIELEAGQSIEPMVAADDHFTNLARRPGVTAVSSGTAAVQGSIGKLFNGVLENWYYTQQSGSEPWRDDSAVFPAWVEIQLPSPQEVSRVLVFASPPWQSQSSLLDYELQYDNAGAWTTLEHIHEPAKTFGVYTYHNNTTVDSFYSERWIFDHRFAPVTTAKFRLLVHVPTFGGGATQIVGEAGGQTGSQRIVLREVELYGPTASPPMVPENLTAGAGDAVVDLTWSPASGATGYLVNRAGSEEAQFSVVASGLTAPAFHDGTVANGTVYRYVVVAVNAAGESGSSNQVIALPQHCLAGLRSSWEYLSPAANPAGTDMDFDTTWHKSAEGFTVAGAPPYDGPAFSGPAPALISFGVIDFDALSGTALPANNSTFYARKVFTAPVGMMLNTELVADDGAVVYIDGVERRRLNMGSPGSPADGYGVFTPDGTVGAENATTRLYLGTVAAGPHIIALSIHNASATSSDIGFDMKLCHEQRRPAITSALFANGSVGTALSYTITSEPDFPADSYGADALPAGLTVNPSTGIISGTPLAEGSFQSQITATNINGTTARTMTFSIGGPFGEVLLPPGGCAGIGFEEAAHLAVSFTRSPAGAELGWSFTRTGTGTLDVRGPVSAFATDHPAAGGIGSAAPHVAPPGQWLRVNNAGFLDAQPFRTEKVNLSSLTTSQRARVSAELDLRTFTTSATTFEAPDTLTIELEGSTDGLTFTRLSTLFTATGGAPDQLILLRSDAGNYTRITSAAGAVTSATRSIRLAIKGRNDSASEYFYIDNLCFRLLPLPDADGDGMPDAWETGNGFNAADPSDAAQDADHDGRSNLEEYAADTVPRDPQSVFTFNAHSFAGGAVSISFDLRPDRSYRVERSTDLQSWQTVQTIAAEDNPRTVGITDAITARHYYRIIVNP